MSSFAAAAGPTRGCVRLSLGAPAGQASRKALKAFGEVAPARRSARKSSGAEPGGGRRHGVSGHAGRIVLGGRPAVAAAPRRLLLVAARGVLRRLIPAALALTRSTLAVVEQALGHLHDLRHLGGGQEVPDLVYREYQII
jgi:hypothetical protein